MYRKANLSDCEKIYRLICELEGKELSYAAFSSIFQKQWNSNDYYGLVYEQNDEITGFLNLRFEHQLHHCECIAEIMEFIVGAEYRNMKIGEGLLEKACQIARESGCAQIEVACNRLRGNAHRFYLREGMDNSHFKFSKLL